EKDYEVHGVVRRASTFNTERIEHLLRPDAPAPGFHLHHGDLSDAGALRNLLDEVRPDEVYNLGAQSHVRISFDQPEYTVDVTAVGVIRVLEAIRTYEKHAGTRVRFYQAGSSEMFGSARPPQHEGTRFEPRSPYACAKVFAHYQVVNHRESYGLFACNGILFNHECVAENTPLVVRRDGILDVTTPDELVPLLRKGRSVQTFEVPGLEIWDGKQWTPVLAITATRRRAADMD